MHAYKSYTLRSGSTKDSNLTDTESKNGVQYKLKYLRVHIIKNEVTEVHNNILT